MWRRPLTNGRGSKRKGKSTATEHEVNEMCDDDALVREKDGKVEGKEVLDVC